MSTHSITNIPTNTSKYYCTPIPSPFSLPEYQADLIAEIRKNNTRDADADLTDGYMDTKVSQNKWQKYNDNNDKLFISRIKDNDKRCDRERNL